MRDCVGVRFSGSGASSRPLNSSLTTKALDSRVNLALQVLALISGDSWEKVQGGDVNYHELSILFSRFMQKKPSLFSMVVERSKFVFCRVLTVAQVVDVKALLHIPMATFRKLRIMLSKFGVKIFPSEPKMRREMISRIEHLKDAQMECEELLMEDVSGDRLLKEIPVLMSKNLIGYISRVFLKLQENGNLFFADPDSTVRIAIGGDKGGDSMKFHFQICHPETSVFDVHIFCMYEGSDCPANMRRALNCFITDFTKMVEPDFRLGGHKVQFLLGGDFKFLDGVLGHMGSSATYPSFKDYCFQRSFAEPWGQSTYS